MSDLGLTIPTLRWLLLLPPAALLLAFALPTTSGFVVQSVEREARVPWSRARLTTLARETTAQALFSALRRLPWPARLPARAPPDQAAATPILLVPCPLWGRPSMTLLATSLRSRGAVVWSSLPLGTDEGLVQQAAALDHQLATFLNHTQAPQVDLVCHGLGGLAAGWLLRHMERPERVRRLVTLATPWQGTKMAAFLPGPAATELRPDAHLLDELWPCPVPTTCLWCPDDPKVVPARSAAPDALKSVSLECAGHVGMLVSARSFRAVWNALNPESQRATT